MIENNIYGYARVSTKEQKIDRQLESLLNFGIEKDRIFIDKQSGKDFDRNEYQILKRFLKLNQGSTLVIKSIDRLGRNYKEIINEWQELTKEYNIDIVVIDMPLLDTRKNKDLMGTFVSDLVLQILSFVAEQERSFIKNRQAEGIALAKKKKKHLGRPKAEWKQEYVVEYKKWQNQQQTAIQTMKNLGLKPTTFYKLYNKNKETIS
ncbi:MAG: recombinase family protein [Clostridia bacterium]|nr:recombinase family protein [Clostridia bacterium]